jgi:hypothetical protein
MVDVVMNVGPCVDGWFILYRTSSRAVALWTQKQVNRRSSFPTGSEPESLSHAAWQNPYYQTYPLV